MSVENQPTAELREEHQIILRVLSVLRILITRHDAGKEFELQSFRTAVKFFKLFADACHHAKEEDLLFPALEARGIPREGGPIGVMLEEHRMARELTARMADALDAQAKGERDAERAFKEAARNYIALLESHIFKEDNVLFNLGDRVLDAFESKKLCTRFCEVGCRSFGGKKKEELAALADVLESTWGRE